MFELPDGLLSSFFGRDLLCDLCRGDVRIDGVDRVLSLRDGDLRGELGHFQLLELRGGLLRFFDRSDRVFVVPSRHLPDEYWLNQLRRLPSWDDIFFPGGLHVVDMR